MKTEKELQVLKEEVESLNNELKELSDEELAQVSGGIINSGSNRMRPSKTEGRTFCLDKN